MAVLQCENCGFNKTVPEAYLDAKVRCPKCSHVNVIQPDADDLGLEDVIGEPEPRDQPQKTAGEGPATDLEEALAAGGPPPPDDTPGFFEGGAAKNILAGGVSGLLTFLISVAIAGLIFPDGDLAAHFPHAVSMALVCAVIMSLVVSFRSSITFSAAGPESLAGLFLFLILTSVRRSMAGGDPQAVYPTIIAAACAGAMLTGLFLLAAGATRRADYTRYIPIQAIGGLLAGIGVMIVAVGMRLTLPAQDSAADLLLLAQDPGQYVKWMPAAAFGFCLFCVLRWVRNSYFILLLVAASVGGFFGWLHLQGVSLDEARNLGLVFQPYVPDLFWTKFYDASFLERIDWLVILGHSGHFIALAGLMVASAMVRVTEMESMDSRPLNLNREFTALGLGNILSALAGGMPGTISHDRSLARRSAGARGRSSGLISGLVLVPGLFYAHEILPFIPRFLASGILVALGLGLIWRWLLESKGRFTQKGDFAALWLVFLLTVSLGLLTGLAVAAGLAVLVTAGRYGSVSVVKHDMSGAHFHSSVDRGPAQIALLKEHGDSIYAMTLQGFIFLGTTNGLTNMIHRRAEDVDRPRLRYVILDFTFISGLDSSVAVNFVKLKQTAVRQGYTLIFANVPFEMQSQLARAGCVLDDMKNGSTMVVSLDYALEWAENQLLERAGLLRDNKQSLSELLAPIFPEKRYIPALMKILRQVRVKKGDPVFKQGAPSDSMYFIESGTVNVQLELEGGRMHRLKKMGPGTVFGEMGLYTSAPRTASIVAAEDCVLHRLSAKVMSLLQTQRPEIASAIHRFIVSLLADRVAGANATIRDLMR
ncbi:SulP family inorganic anion transporter [Desulfocurvus sp. DL9XJH121]